MTFISVLQQVTKCELLFPKKRRKIERKTLDLSRLLSRYLHQFASIYHVKLPEYSLECQQHYIVYTAEKLAYIEKK